MGAMISIRTATAADDAAIVAIDDATWSPTNSPVPAPAGPRSAFADLPTSDVLVAVTPEDRVAGYVQWHNVFGIESHAHVLEINGLAVDPAQAGRGIGTALVEAAVAELGRRGARKVTLRVLATNPAARRLYARCSFVEEGVLRGEFLLEGAEVDDVLMARHLTR
jgi:ribosomal protein S18 acetylase RimI-like enzyme